MRQTIPTQPILLSMVNDDPLRQFLHENGCFFHPKQALTLATVFEGKDRIGIRDG